MSRQLIEESRDGETIPGHKPLLHEPKHEEQANIYSKIPRTGIEQPFLIDPPVHKREPADNLERINDLSPNLKATIIEDYRMREASRVINFAKTVYDAEKESPHYRNQVDFLDPTDTIRITRPTVNGRPVENLKPPTKNRYFKELKPWYKPYQYTTSKSEKDDVLLFESRFESGNLKEAIQLDNYEYELVLKPDYGTKNYTQWFYFKISNTRRYREYIFHIINFVKPDSQFNDGMMPLFYSKQRKQGWYRSGYDIAYYLNNQPYCKIFGENAPEQKSSKEPTTFYTLSFKFTLKHDNDEVYIAMCYPYTYTDCIRYLDGISNNLGLQSVVRRTSLCKTSAGNSLEMLIITNFSSSGNEMSRRKCVVLTARVHPGESNSSFVMEGLISFLLSSDLIAVNLRDRFVFKVVPMLNPDGVIIGNYRASLSGYDLNRQYQAPSPKTFPEIFAIKQMLRKTQECRRIELYCDFHGHSRQKDLFMYGCGTIASG